MLVCWSVDIQSCSQEIFEPNIFVGGGFNPFEKHARQIGSFPQGSG